MKMKHFLLLVLTIFITASCASNQGKILEYKKYIATENYGEALKLAKEGALYNDKESRLLKHLELGTLYFNLGYYYQAVKEFDVAREIADKNFTTSLSKKTLGILVNESQDIYYGENYELSLLRYYTMLGHYMLYSNGEYEAYEDLVFNDEGKVIERKQIEKKTLDESQKRFHLNAARAIVLEWNSVLEQMKQETAGEVTYKDDLLAKYVAATVHQNFGTTSDKQIALALYKDSQNTLFRYYNSYESFNLKYKDFNSEFSKMHTYEQKNAESKFVEATKNSNAVLNFSKQVINNWNKKDSEKDNVQLVWHNGKIAEKEIKQYDFPLPVGTFKVSVGTQVDFLSFTRSVLTVSDGIIPRISFQMASIPYRKNNQELMFIIKQNDVVVAEKNALLVDPLSEMAHQSIDSKSLKNSLTKGARLAAKHLAALGASYASFTQLKESLGPDFALLSAVAAYKISTRGIEATEEADLRSWITLPNEIRLNTFKLKTGHYEVFVKDSFGIERLVGRISVDASKNLDLKILVK